MISLKQSPKFDNEACELKVYSTVRWYQFAKDFEVFSLIKIHSNHFLLLSEPFCCGQVTKKVLMHLFG